MDSATIEQVRRFRLQAHHLDRWYPKSCAEEAAGACGFQNSPPGAWESALCNRIAGVGPGDAKRLLEAEKTLLQAWSFRGAPVVFPLSQSDAFLSALVPKGEEPWVYTRGIELALTYLQMSFEELLALLCRVMPRLDDRVLKSKTALDQTLAAWMLPRLPPHKRDAWRAPSMYGSPDTQTVGGAVVSFLLRPCALMGLVVFGAREGTSPTFTSYRRWTGRPLKAADAPEQRLVRKYLHCFGPASVGGLAAWLGCSPAQAGRLWRTVAEEVEPVQVQGKQRWLLAEDKRLLLAAVPPQRRLHLLAGHDPYLGLQDREMILEDKARQRQLWQTVSNPGAVLWQGGVAGLWKGRKKANRLEMDLTLWEGADIPRRELEKLAAAHAAARQLAPGGITYL